MNEEKNIADQGDPLPSREEGLAAAHKHVAGGLAGHQNTGGHFYTIEQGDRFDRIVQSALFGFR